jgi:hypothetical protein
MVELTEPHDQILADNALLIKIELSPSVQAKFSNILSIDKESLKLGKELRKKSIEKAIGLEIGPSQDARVLHPVWNGNGYEVGLGKPGKEAITTRSRVNKNDMWPYVRSDAGVISKDATFRMIFKELEHMHNKSRYALELLACLLVRDAYLLDHKEVDGKIIYSPPQAIVDEISKDIPQIFGIPLEAFLRYLDAIALNEDVKYYTLGEDRGKAYGTSAGRPNNLLTCAYLIAVLLGRAELVDFAYGFSRMKGVSAIPLKKAKECFPLLSIKEKDEDI